MPDPLADAAEAYGRKTNQSVNVPAGQDNIRGVSPWLRPLAPLLWFRNVKALLFILGATIVITVTVFWADWRALLIVPVAGFFANMWWKHHTRPEQVMLFEIRARGQLFRYPHTPFDFLVPDSAARIFFGPKRLYDHATKWGVYQPILEMPANVVVCDYFDETRNLIIFNEDPEFSNLALVAQLNKSKARELRMRGTKLLWIEQQKRKAVEECRAGHMTREELMDVLANLDEDSDVIKESPLMKRSFAHHYQNEIPKLRRQVIELMKGIEEYGYAVGAEMLFRFYGQPLTPQIEQNIAMRKTKWSKLKMSIFRDFELTPSEIDDDPRKYAAQELHELAQRAAGASARATSIDTPQAEQPVV